MTQAVIPQKSSLSTEVLRVLVRGNIAGVLVDPTIYAVSAAALDSSHPGGKRVPVTADYVTQSWETGTGPRYWASVLMGPSATLNPAGPGTGVASITYELWLRIIAGSEDVRRLVGLFAVTP